MHHCRIVLVLFLLAASCPTWAVDVQQIPQSVEEPDTPDESQDADIPEDAPWPLPDSEMGAQPQPAPQPAPPTAVGETGNADYDQVVLRGLNKVTARAQTIEAAIGSVVRFGTIEIVAHRCWKAAPDERPENAALLEISEIKQGEAPTRIFLGWMFSSSPGLSSLEHPFYDVTVVGCGKAASPEVGKAKKLRKR